MVGVQRLGTHQNGLHRHWRIEPGASCHLVRLKRPTTTTLHYPYPPIRSPSDWKPQSIWGISGDQDLAKDTACFPAKDIRDSIVDAFFEKIHPGFPIVEEAMFRSQYTDPTCPPPLILFQCILLAGAHACDHPLVAASRNVVKKTLFRRASMLFHIHHETDRLYMAQAALLFSWHLENSDTVCGGSYYWLGLALRIGYGMGVHRDLTPKAGSRLPEWERRIYRRTWWTLFQAEVFSCLEHGRPCAVDPEDFDQPPLQLQDFVEGQDEEVNQRIEFDYCVQNVRLSYIGLQVLHLNKPSRKEPPMAASIQASLAEFAFDLSMGDTFWSCQLRMHYHLVSLHLHRSLMIHPRDSGTLTTDEATLRGLCNDAGQGILACFEEMSSKGWLGQCSFTGPSALMAAAVQFTDDVRHAVAQTSPLLGLNAQNRLVRLLQCAKRLEEYWPSAGAVHGLFDELSRELRLSAKNSGKKETTESQENVQQEDTRQDEAPESDFTDWAGNFGPFDFATFDFGRESADFSAEQWMNEAGIL